jgi:hypothetical protein
MHPLPYQLFQPAESGKKAMETWVIILKILRGLILRRRDLTVTTLVQGDSTVVLVPAF